MTGTQKPRLGGDAWAAVALSMIVVAVFAASERIGVNDGLGWDGREYGRWARDFPSFRTGLESYRAHRILPSALVYSALRLGSVPTTTANVVGGFVVLDAIAVVIALLSWRYAAIALDVGPAARTFGLTALVVNFAVAKWMPYNPVLTDAAALMLGSLAVASWASGRRAALVGVSLLAAFTWPALLAPCSLLILCPRRRSPGELPSGEGRPGMLLAGATGLGVFIFLVIVALAGGRAFESQETAGWVAVRLRLVHPLALATVVSAGLLGVAGFFSTRPLWGILVAAETWKGFRRGLLWRALAVAAVHAATWYAVSLMTSDQARGSRDYLVTAAFTGLRWPLVSFVAHAAFFGPVVVLMAVEWKTVCRAMGRDGPGVILCVLVALVQAVDSESRHVLPLFPLMVCYTAKGVEDLGWGRARLIEFGALAAACSKVWLPIGPMPKGPRSSGAMPWQTELYTMSIGPRMSWRMYLAQAGVTGLLVAAFWRAVTRARSRSVQA